MALSGIARMGYAPDNITPTALQSSIKNHPGMVSLNFHTNWIITENVVTITADWLIKAIHVLECITLVSQYNGNILVQFLCSQKQTTEVCCSFCKTHVITANT